MKDLPWTPSCSRPAAFEFQATRYLKLNENVLRPIATLPTAHLAELVVVAISFFHACASVHSSAANQLSSQHEPCDLRAPLEGGVLKRLHVRVAHHCNDEIEQEDDQKDDQQEVDAQRHNVGKGPLVVQVINAAKQLAAVSRGDQQVDHQDEAHEPLASAHCRGGGIVDLSLGHHEVEGEREDDHVQPEEDHPRADVAKEHLVDNLDED
eukprot:CAMPEP_0182795944 /NCGR_PEP_ID=MMETSP0006_2-20121128/10_1 /TAXON_ID=97485 /ORGANISM="Prymnesium parvum, Strain Texoma1" /LENGTH=208 /DNA_ID=CAMNT_0024920875 /DNA_START=518 /DNA_END=1142 /DNA_ORIENTATION=-